jgi:hypothetical protein
MSTNREIKTFVDKRNDGDVFVWTEVFENGKCVSDTHEIIAVYRPERRRRVLEGID